MATTTNFGWETPDDTDLVKDGALAIRTLGSAIDTSLVDLKGGTTGQVLSKTSNTDMDFTWVTSDDANAIQNAIVDAKGDLIAASAADTPARLAVGNNGETLVADSSTSTGLRWQTVAQQNSLINSNFSVWQRGTSQAVTSTSTSFYGPDRWQIFRGATGSTVSRQATGDTTNLPNIQYAMRIQRDSGNTSTAAILPAYSMETADSIKFAGQSVVFSFYARRGANYSATSNALGVVGRSGTGTDQNLNAGYTGSADFINTSVTLTTTWQRFTTSGVVSSSATELGFQFNFTPTGTAGANDWVEITGLQAEIGSTPTAYRPYSATLAGELAACQRYYWRAGGDNLYQYFALGVANTTTNIRFVIQNPVGMRTAPTSVDYSNVLLGGGGTDISNPTLTLDQGSRYAQAVNAAVTGQTQFRTWYMLANNSLNTYIGFSAEL